MYSKTGKLDKEEAHALNVVVGNISETVSLRLLQYLDVQGLIILNRTVNDSCLTSKGQAALNKYDNQ